MSPTLKRLKFGNDGVTVYPPFHRQQEIIRALLEPDGEKKRIDLCCGLGYGKTTLAIIVACLTMSADKRHRGLFLEPDWHRVRSVFLPEWRRIVPPELYTIHLGDNRITWINGAEMEFGPRVITGSRERAADRARGPNLSFIIDDEAAIGFDMELHTNLDARVRLNLPTQYVFTTSTPKAGPYADMLRLPGHVLYKGKTSDNPYHPPGYVEGLRRLMSTNQARRELDGELVALEGLIYDEWSTARWPEGNIVDDGFNPDNPFWVAMDIGFATAVAFIVQPIVKRGITLSNVVAEFIPQRKGGAQKIFADIDRRYGRPVHVVGGHDIDTGDSGSGRSTRWFARQQWPGVQVTGIGPGLRQDKEAQIACLSYGVCNTEGERRLVASQKIRTYDDGGHVGRGIMALMDQATFPGNMSGYTGESWAAVKRHLGPLDHAHDAMLYFSIWRWPPTYGRRKAIAA